MYGIYMLVLVVVALFAFYYTIKYCFSVTEKDVVGVYVQRGKHNNPFLCLKEYIHVVSYENGWVKFKSYGDIITHQYQHVRIETFNQLYAKYKFANIDCNISPAIGAYVPYGGHTNPFIDEKEYIWVVAVNNGWVECKTYNNSTALPSYQSYHVMKFNLLYTKYQFA